MEGITIVLLSATLETVYDEKIQSRAGEGRSRKRYQFKLRTAVNISASNMT